ncbi:PAS domain S-box-containing protein/diguanylate cyclase (GGDEF) domain-containing protein [Arsukibacterium tuosuense]|uniref:Sensor protein FixL n=1 Tax=Arsukibacterium tuosuense TaxID=1323745 RepID=A0A285IZD8_9GAMM|nr:EAL domain-containing protein [Arsukibacterium tuosuense]SNY53342.1 PAS domain S-box-containing protein/diguanylate cyclase (GGDEF) domain-containing protein [Arsukibacterium tuosuense]
MQEMPEDLGLLYRAMMTSATDAIVVIDHNGIILHFSSSAEVLFNCKANECIGKSVNMLMPEPFRTEYVSYLNNHQKTGNASIIGRGRDVIGLKSDGTEFPMHLSACPARIKQSLYYIGIYHDLSDYSKKLSEKLQIESLHNALFDAAVDGIITINKTGIIDSFNKAAERLFGYMKEEVIGQNIKVLMPSPYREAHDGYLHNYAMGGTAQIIGIGRDVSGLKKNGDIFPMRLSVGKALTEDGDFYIGVCHDLTSYQDALLQLATAEQRYKSIVECQGQIICRLDSNYNITFANQTFQTVFNCNEDEMLGLKLINFIPDDKIEMQQVLLEVANSEAMQQTHFKSVMLRKGSKFNIEWWFTRVQDNTGSTEIQGFGIDISEKEEAIRQATFLKNHDALTGLLNIDAFTQSFDNWTTAEHYAIFYLDYNHLNLINNRFGFNIGDKILVETAKRLKIALPQPALLCRPGADEFIVAVEIATSTAAKQLAQSILDSLKQPYFIGEHKIKVNAKIGIALFPDDAVDIGTVIRQAESALPKAKQSQNNVAFYDLDFHSSLQRRLDVEQRLGVALDENLLQVFLQPKVDLLSNQTIGYEALLRWQDPILGSVSPIEFIKIAEEMSLAIQVDRYVLKTVFQTIRRSIDQDIRLLPIAVNITSCHFGDAALIDYIFTLSNKLDVPLELLDLEVTESVLLEMSPQVEKNLQWLRQSGIKISIDDFGTGYSSLSYIRKLAVDTLKIDKSFIDEITDETGQKLVAAVIAIAQAVNLDVIAEGVETKQQLDILSKLGCKKGQGYYFARPKFIDDVLF